MKKMYGRFQQKHDTEANWLLATNFAPLAGEVIIYDADENYDYPRFKVGIWDGISEKTDDMMVNNLPFVFPSQISTTYAELKQLRDSGRLIPGMFYRVTDYECTTVQEGTRAMNNRFDIIIQALSSSTLSENASADYHYENNQAISYFNIEYQIDSNYVKDIQNKKITAGDVPIHYIAYEDYASSSYEDGIQDPDTPDEIVGYDFLPNYDGNIVPVLYKTNTSQIDADIEYAEPDYLDPFYYVGDEEVDGIVYAKWRNIEDATDEQVFHWLTDAKKYIYTDPIVITNNVANIPAWKLKYCLDNDTNKFAWACDMKGIKEPAIMNLKSLFSNGLPLTRQPKCDIDQWDEINHPLYEYKYAWGTLSDVINGDPTNFWYSKTENISTGDMVYSNNSSTYEQVIMASEDGKGVIYYMKDEWNNECPYDFKNIQFQRSAEWQEEHSEFIAALGLVTHDVNWFYTFSYINEDMVVEDLTLKQNLQSDDDSIKFGTHDNSILSWTGQDSINTSPRAMLNNNIMIYSSSFDPFFYGCYNNKFKNNCRNNTFGSGNFNTLGNECVNNIFGSGCDSNIFGDFCSFNTLGDWCYGNIFKRSCENNIFGDACFSNTFGEYCGFNTFGYYCCFNSFGINCTSNIFGNSINNLIPYVRFVHFADNCHYIKLLNSEPGNNSNNYVQNIVVLAGVSGGQKSSLELQVSRNASPVVYEAAGTTHIILDQQEEIIYG